MKALFILAAILGPADEAQCDTDSACAMFESHKAYSPDLLGVYTDPNRPGMFACAWRGRVVTQCSPNRAHKLKER